MSPINIIARQIAARRVKAELAAHGFKPYEVKASDIKRWANAYLDQHAELLAEADAVIEASLSCGRSQSASASAGAGASSTRVLRVCGERTKTCPASQPWSGPRDCS